MESRIIYSATGKPFTDKDAAEAKAQILTLEVGRSFKAQACDGGYCVKETSNTDTYPEFGVDPGFGVDQGSPPKETQVVMPDEQSSPPQKVEPQKVKEEDKVKAVGGARVARLAASDTLKIKPSMWGFPGYFFVVLIGIAVILEPNLMSGLLMGGVADQELTGIYLLAAKGMGLVIVVFGAGKVAIEWLSNTYRLTRTSVESVEGILSKKTARINISDIRSIDMEQNIIERMCAVGTISLATAGTAEDEIKMEKIAMPNEIQNEIQRRLEANK